MKNIIKLYVFLLFLSFFVFSGIVCSSKEYNPFYFIMLPYLRKGLQKPEKVINIRAIYNPQISSIELSWNPSKDPDTQQYVPYYYIYIYYQYPKPDQFYDKKYLLDIAPSNQYILTIQNFIGTLYFIITAYDLGAESEPSEIIEVTVP